uniref:Replication termination factor 2 n=1 Tax=Pyramimonas obovata TaxID=1411642 RepID=A0A7S0N047_9CHLO|mmetsp:Transcript_15892/g.34468  ORF Transcript_15892/g.34468 Transcript_15892/m.34468 type:complete len:328 (+) Transcript_15892:232-1215(+)|eukprot:CAMPEP_0118946318 /NCGR_PEP_ID=MMETSP1169-20130426/44015_1 /TAXON_ID=36882 /ORGANISM="Pyramimonas obovata, Strain CCMP722" /LENGTH=327 /DNA_ID=CAMNT_0006892253 /DNA_START=151 /DNA_END=1137 /DNA_ORIENTATION=+
MRLFENSDKVSMGIVDEHSAGLGEAVLRLRGGGGDGGATGAESRDSYLQMYAQKKPEKVDPREEKLAAATQCRLTHEPLSESPDSVVLDPLGHLYNKEQVLHALLEKKLNKTAMPAGLEHVASLKQDTLVLKLTTTASMLGDTSAAKKPASQGNFQRGNEAPFCCPLTARQMNGMFKFVALRPSGWVFSEQAVKECKQGVEEMIGGPLTDQEVIPINGSEEEVDELYKKHSLKCSTKKKKEKGVAAADGEKRKSEAGAGPPAAKKTKQYNGCTDMATEIAKANAKAYSAGKHAPKGATESIYASLFTSSTVHQRKESYGARNLSIHR